ncbi:glycosyltransferase family 4 protein [Bacteroidales bacterium]|nr:glycosyltransferase family 4 protein [Bacteroidales bacterium]
MNIGIIIGRIGGVDGVALETEKWIEVLKKMGHTVYIVAGQYEERRMNCEYEDLIREMSFFSPESYWAQKKAFHHPEPDVEELKKHLSLYSKVIYKKLNDWVKKRNIEIIISENASALPFHLEMGLGIKHLVTHLKLPTITHDHDFAWERGSRYSSPHPDINEYVSQHFPLRADTSIHAVINLNAQNYLKKHYNRDSVVVPNVMDFNMEFGLPDANNADLPEALGYSKDDKLLFQITRIVRRKGIETAIKLLDKLHDDRIKLIITGDHKDDANPDYYNELQELAFDLNLSRNVNFAGHIFNNHRGTINKSDLTYSLSDGYAHAAGCTYFSTYEGFGNAFVEAVLAKKPIFVNNYEPVYWPDIGSKGFKTVQIENNELNDDAVKQMADIIYNPKLASEIGEYNFELGKKHFSYETLEEKLQELIDKALSLYAQQF